MTLNGVMALILRYFTEFVKQLPRFQNLLLIVYDHTIVRCVQLFNDYLGKTNSDNSVDDGRRCFVIVEINVFFLFCVFLFSIKY